MSSVDTTALNPPLAFKLWWQGVSVVAAWLAVAVLISYWPNATRHWPLTQGLANLCVGVAVLFIGLSLLGRHVSTLGRRLRNAGPWLLALPVLLGIWELLTAKLALLPVPFFAPPQALLAVYLEDYARLADSLLHSALLLGSGVALGAATGFVAGVAIGWSTRIGYWLHPVLRILGPVPSTALLPLCFFLFPSSWSASVFLIALATWFPVTVLTWSGVASVDKALSLIHI